MAGQGFERREVLRLIGLASVAGTFPGFQRWAFACPHAADNTSPARKEVAPYRPLFFSSEQFSMVDHLAEMIIPADDSPGAKEAGVAEFIDFMVANRVPVISRDEIRNTQDAIQNGEEIQGEFIYGLGWLNARCKAEFGHEFMGSSPEEQNGLLEELAYKAKFKPDTESGRDFFRLIREYTVVGYYTSRIGLTSLGYPGLRTVWPAMPGCTHRDDPEHAHRQEPNSSKLAMLVTAN